MATTTKTTVQVHTDAQGNLLETFTTTETTVTSNDESSNVTQVTAADLMEPGTAPAQ